MARNAKGHRSAENNTVPFGKRPERTLLHAYICVVAGLVVPLVNVNLSLVLGCGRISLESGREEDHLCSH